MEENDFYLEFKNNEGKVVFDLSIGEPRIVEGEIQLPINIGLTTNDPKQMYIPLDATRLRQLLDESK